MMGRTNREDFSIQIDRAIANLQEAQALAWTNKIYDRNIDMAFNVLNYSKQIIGQIGKTDDEHHQ